MIKPAKTTRSYTTTVAMTDPLIKKALCIPKTAENVQVEYDPETKTFTGTWDVVKAAKE